MNKLKATYRSIFPLGVIDLFNSIWNWKRNNMSYNDYLKIQKGIYSYSELCNGIEIRGSIKVDAINKNPAMDKIESNFKSLISGSSEFWYCDIITIIVLVYYMHKDCISKMIRRIKI